ncbi:unnamed protein product [Zymoseptoria tritici ST99CH_3D1]|nr:unnamed protein product [Zymoseptoria tritici ST99CH_3D1]
MLKMFNKHWVLAVSILPTVLRAQLPFTPGPLPPPDITNTVMNITFSDPSNRECGRSSASPNDSNTIIVRDAGAKPVCLELDYVFTHPNTTYSHPTDGIAPSREFDLMRYTISNSAGWSPDRFNYSQIFYTQRWADPNRPDDTSRVANIMFRAFNESRCPGYGKDVGAAGWYSWNCASENGSCNVLPFGVKSIMIGHPDGKYSPGDKGCIAAVKLNAGHTTSAASCSMLAAVLGVAALLVL